MRVRAAGFLATAAAFALLLAPGVASACHGCKKNPCVLVAAPAYQCVTEMVPRTIYKTRTRMTFRPITETIMVPEAQTTFVERQRVVCKPVWDTQYVQRSYTYCRQVPETTYVTQYYTVCNPVTVTRQVTDYYLQPTTHLVAVPVTYSTCGHCGKAKTHCGCSIVAQTSYTPIPYLRTATFTELVSRTLSRQVPVTCIKIIPEVKVETIPIKTCRIIQDVVIERIPITTFRCVPKQITRQICIPVREPYAEVCYVPVQRMVPCAPAYYPAPTPGPAPYPAPQAAPQS